MHKKDFEVEGRHDTEYVRQAFMASPFIDWTRFAEQQGWNPHTSRREYPVKSWQDEKKKLLAEKNFDVIGAIMFERKFSWTKEILETLERYPKLAENGSRLIEAKMHHYNEVFKDYIEWKKQGLDKQKDKFNRKIKHDWEKIDAFELSALAQGIKVITEAKHKSLMLDKWAEMKLDIPKEEISAENGDQAADNSNRITVEGKKELTFDQIQLWFDEFADKPVEKVVENPAEQTKPEPKQVTTYKGVQILDDNGRPIDG